MRYLVRSTDETALTKLIEQRLDCERIYLYPAGMGAAALILDRTRTSIKALSAALSDIIIENLQIKHIHRRIDLYNPALSKALKREITLKALKELYGRKNIAAIREAKEDVAERLALYIDECGDGSALCLEGFMRFRMKDYTKRWDGAVDAALSGMADESVYNEFIGVLSCYLRHAECKLECVHVYVEHACEEEDIVRDGCESCAQGVRYRVTDGAGNGVELNKFNAPDWFTYDMTSADKLLSTLLNLCPTQIFIHDALKVERKELLNSIYKIFAGRVFFV